jgi:hypothetical protein
VNLYINLLDLIHKQTSTCFWDFVITNPLPLYKVGNMPLISYIDLYVNFHFKKIVVHKFNVRTNLVGKNTYSNQSNMDP